MALRTAYISICKRDGVTPRLDLFADVEGTRALSADLTLLEDPDLRALFSLVGRHAYTHLTSLRLFCNKLSAYDQYKLELRNFRHANPLVLRPIASNRLASAIQQCITPDQCQIRWLELFGFAWTSAGLSYLSSALGANRSVIGLSLKDCQIGDEGLSILLPGLRSNTTVEQLQLSGCNLTNVGAIALRGLIAHHYARRVREDWHDTLHDTAPRRRKPGEAAPRARAVRGLTSLDLSGNGIGDAGVCALTEAFRDDPYITAVDLRRNRLSGRSRKEVAEAVRSGGNCGLRFCDLRENPDCDWALGLDTWESWGAAQAPAAADFAARDDAAGDAGRRALRKARSAPAAPLSEARRAPAPAPHEAPRAPRPPSPAPPASEDGSEAGPSSPPAAASSSQREAPAPAQLQEERLARAVAERRLADALRGGEQAAAAPTAAAAEDAVLGRIEGTLASLAAALERLEAHEGGAPDPSSRKFRAVAPEEPAPAPLPWPTALPAPPPALDWGLEDEPEAAEAAAAAARALEAYAFDFEDVDADVDAASPGTLRYMRAYGY
eukprot:tig00000615_g2545.t1